MAALRDLPNVAMSFIMVAVIFVAGFLVLAGLGDSTTDADATNAIGNVTSGLNNIISYAPIWGVILGVAVLLTIVIGGFMFARGRGYL